MHSFWKKRQTDKNKGIYSWKKITKPAKVIDRRYNKMKSRKEEVVNLESIYLLEKMLLRPFLVPLRLT